MSKSIGFNFEKKWRITEQVSGQVLSKHRTFFGAFRAFSRAIESETQSGAKVHLVMAKVFAEFTYEK